MSDYAHHLSDRALNPPSKDAEIRRLRGLLDERKAATTEAEALAALPVDALVVRRANGWELHYGGQTYKRSSLPDAIAAALAATGGDQ
jgi:hypothetical protein